MVDVRAKGEAVRYVAEKGKINVSGFKSIAPMVSDKTLYRDLQDLVEKEVLKGVGEKKGWFYVSDNSEE